jgi:hypothetical protein
MHSTLANYQTKTSKHIPFEGNNAKAICGETHPKLFFNGPKISCLILIKEKQTGNARAIKEKKRRWEKMNPPLKGTSTISL